ncbi:hypothetical protein [Yersinia intermedia]|uniref:hypothetical protein n=1 Tax=Yersinia intermedia TaxID=631 RepID=UPI001F537ACA|nr:hypothetical protein [Yersinia intermedia]UNK24789.1 hypothetical protein MNQ97_07410 [Yersinia intermedia]
MADKILPPSVLSRRLNNEEIRGGFSPDIYNKIITFANSLSKQEIEDFIFLADNCYSAYLNVKNLALANNPDAKELYSEFYSWVTSGMSGALRTYIPYYISGLGGLVTFIGSILMAVEVNITEDKEQINWKITDGVVKSAFGLVALVAIITGVVNNAGNYNDQMIKLIKTVVELRLSGMKYLEDIKLNHAKNKQNLIDILYADNSGNGERKRLIKFINTIFNNEFTVKSYNIAIKQNEGTRTPIFRLKTINETLGEPFYLETEKLWDNIISQIGTGIEFRAPTPPDNIVVISRHNERRNSVSKRFIANMGTDF